MSNLVDLEKLFHRSLDRIRDFGEVFTPDQYVEDMLDIITDKKNDIWSNEDIAFFEPCCGHGNIACAIYKRRLKGLYKKAVAHGLDSDAPYYAVANALNSLWAIDIDSENIDNCRSRILILSIKFLKDRTNIKNTLGLIKSNKVFFTHLLAAIKWHIDENETISALAPERTNISTTKYGEHWCNENGVHKINFQQTWVEFYEECESQNLVPIDYERASVFIGKVLSGKIRGFDDFSFAKPLFTQSEKFNNEGKLSIEAAA